MIICPKCHAENLLTAVFCRNCGEKLELDKLTPETLQDTKKKGKGGKLAGQIISLVLCIVIIGLIAGSLIPVGGVIAKTDPEKKVYNSYIKFASSKHYSHASEVTFSDAEASAVLSRILLKKEAEKGYYVPSNVTVHFTSDGFVKVLMTYKASVLNLTTTVKAALSTEEKQAGLKFDPVSARFGYIPIPMSLTPFLIEKFQTAAESKLSKAQKKVKEVTVSENSITLKK